LGKLEKLVASVPERIHMKKILILFVLALVFVLAPQDAFAQKIKKPQAKTDPTLRPNKKSQKKKDKFLKKKKKRGAITRPSDFMHFTCEELRSRIQAILRKQGISTRSTSF
jgi:hypothetical protein